MSNLYLELLQSRHWKITRDEIVNRDGFMCQNCLNKIYLKQGDITCLRIKPCKNGSGSLIIIESDEHIIYKVFINRKFTSFFNLKEKPEDTLAVVFRVVESKCQLLGICSINQTISTSDLAEELNCQIEKELENFTIEKNISQEKKEVLRSIQRSALLKMDLFDTPLLRGIILKKRIKNSELDLKKIRWTEVKNLHVHHKYYQKGKSPWEYPDEALTTLCWDCHESLHKIEKVPYLDENGIQIGSLTPCSRCYGAGEFPEFNYIQDGICFRCNGAKYEELF